MGKNNIVDIDLSVTKKKQFRIDKDDTRIIELNTSDMNILSRLQDSYPKLDALSTRAMELSAEASMEDTVTLLRDIDKEMREILNYPKIRTDENNLILKCRLQSLGTCRKDGIDSTYFIADFPT